MLGNVLFLILAAMVGAAAAWFLAAAGHNRKMQAQLASAQTSLKRTRAHLRTVLGRLPIGIVILDAGTRKLVFANDRGQDVLMSRAPAQVPFADADGNPVDAAHHPFATLPSNATPALYHLLDKGRRPMHLEISSMALADEDTGESTILFAILDETERVETEQVLERSHRLEALGTLTKGVAHDFNNMLTPIVGSLDILRRDQGISPASARAIDRALQATGRASTLVHRLQAFSRQQDLQTHVVDLQDLVEGAYDLFARKLGAGIDAFVQVKQSVQVEIDPHQLELAMLNLMVNARDAMPKGGELTISVDKVVLAEPAHGLPAGEYGRISVTDTGVGMTDDVRKRAIEPFFTTKEVGVASGLGLSMVDGLLAQSGGRLGIESVKGEGTRVDLWIPAVTGDAAAREGEGDAFTPTVKARILLVDDEDLVRSATADMLTSMGHTVVEASTGAEAITAIRRGGNFQAVIADHLMPGMTGGAMAHEIWDFLPKMPILLISGYAHTKALPSDLPRLAKPFRNADLARAVEALLTRDAPTPPAK